jgi:hypothetical protein
MGLDHEHACRDDDHVYASGRRRDRRERSCDTQEERSSVAGGKRSSRERGTASDSVSTILISAGGTDPGTPLQTGELTSVTAVACPDEAGVLHIPIQLRLPVSHLQTWYKCTHVNKRDQLISEITG